MKLNEIIGTQQERTAEILQYLDLENTLSLYYPIENGDSLRHIPVKAEYFSTGAKRFPNGRISLYIDESNPEITIKDGEDTNIHLGERFLATYIKKGVLVSIENENAEIKDVELETEPALMHYMRQIPD